MHGFINCTFPLNFAPTVNVEYYFTRKGDYATKGLVICDNTARKTWIVMGGPGSIYQNRVWSNSKIYLGKDKRFTHKEYLLGDSAFSTSPVMVPAFKKGNNANLSEERKYFNTKKAQIRIKSEHCIGLLNAWFQHLRGFWHVITDKKDLDDILKQTMYACIRHNLLFEHTVLLDWFEDNFDELE